MSTRHRILKNLAKIFDLWALIGAFVAASVLVYSTPETLSLTRLLSLRITIGNSLLFVLLLITWHNVFVLCGVYVSKRLVDRRTEIMEIAKGTALSAVVLSLAAKVFHIGVVNSLFVMLFWVCCTISMIVGRLLARPLLASLRRRGGNSRFVLVVGTNERAVEFARRITDQSELGYRIVGFVDDEWNGIHKFETSGYARCCSFSGLADFLRHNVVDEAAIYLPVCSYYEHAAQLVSQCEEHGIAIRFDSQVFNLRGAQFSVHDLDESSQVFSVSTHGEFWPSVAKRVLDFVLSAVLLILFGPFLIVVALIIKLASPGPVFFSQTRVGLNKRQFRMYKFRTMVADAEQMQGQLLALNEMGGPAFKIKNDPRVTSLGKFLRKTSIDELPQLFNVLTGDMSLVGPRAMSLRDYQLFDKDWQRRRFSVKPGITCLWQINGRNSISFDKWMELDMQYIDKWSLWLDMKILLRTLPAVLRGTGAA